MSEDATLRDWLYDPTHPWKSPLVGKTLSRTLCVLGHQVVIMDLDTWEEPWLACGVCGARFIPESVLDSSDEDGETQ